MDVEEHGGQRKMDGLCEKRYERKCSWDKTTDQNNGRKINEPRLKNKLI